MKFIYILSLCLLFTNCYVYKTQISSKEEETLPIQNQLQIDQFYKIKVDNHSYKIKAVEWEGDSLTAHVNFKEKNLKKFHKNDITEVQQRTFARGKSDALTFGIYGGITALIILLTR
ncbi:MAG: hypothetical protein ACR2MS_04790 [Weeksellaceae bacterium]